MKAIVLNVSVWYCDFRGNGATSVRRRGTIRAREAEDFTGVIREAALIRFLFLAVVRFLLRLG